jgi:hypothetical protein
MRIDRYTKTILTIIAIALSVIAVQPWVQATGWIQALQPDRADAQTPTAKYDVAIPRSWGKYLAYSNNNLLLLADDQTMRIVDVEGKPPEYPKVKALIRWQ